MASYIVTAPAAVVIVAGARVQLDRGTRVPEAADADHLLHLLDVGLVEVADGAEPDAVLPPVLSLDDLTAAQLRQLAAERGVEVRKGATKASLIEALTVPADPPSPAPDAPSDKALADMTVDQLLAQAAARGIDVPEGVTDPADLVAILEQ